MIRQVTDEYGLPVGQAHINPMLDIRKIEVELENGETEKIMAKQITANFYYQLENEGREVLKFKGIIYHKNYGSSLTKRALLY